MLLLVLLNTIDFEYALFVLSNESLNHFKNVRIELIGAKNDFKTDACQVHCVLIISNVPIIKRVPDEGLKQNHYGLFSFFHFNGFYVYYWLQKCIQNYT